MNISCFRDDIALVFENALKFNTKEYIKFHTEELEVFNSMKFVMVSAVRKESRFENSLRHSVSGMG